MKQTLSQKVARSGIWAFTLRIIERSFSLIKLIILARILAPSDFGLMGVALLTMATLEAFSQTGFQQALIQKKDDIKAYLDTVWTVLILRGVLLFIILYLIAPYAAVFFKAPQARFIIQVMGISLLLEVFTNIGVIYFQKELEFNKQFIYQLSGTLADFIVAISAALILRNTWALVFGFFAGNVARFIVSYLIHPFRPHINFDLVKTRELFGFGKWVFGSSVLVFLLIQGDDIFVGKILGVTLLGFYQMAYKFSNIPATEYSHLIATVIFPAYSKLQHNLSKLREAYFKVLQLTGLISIPLAGGILILGQDFTTIFLGEKWLPMVPAMQILALFGMFRAIGATTGAVFLAIGRPEIRTKIQSAQLILLAFLIYPFTMQWGILGTAIAVTIYASLFNLVAVYKVLNFVKGSYKLPIKFLGLPLISTFIMAFFIFVLKTYIFNITGIFSFFIFVIIGAFIYLVITQLFDLFFNYGSKHLIQTQFLYLLSKDNKTLNS